MRLSLWIISDYLREYKPLCCITDGEMTIRNVRLLSEQESLVSVNLYIGKKSWFQNTEHLTASAFYNNFMKNDDEIKNVSNSLITKTDPVLCIHGNDALILNTEDLGTVFNRILDCFDFYNTWADSCIDMIAQHASLEEIMLNSRKIFREEINIADSSHVLLYQLPCLMPDEAELTSQQRAYAIFSQSIRENHSMPLDYILQARQMGKIYQPGIKAYRSVLNQEMSPSVLVNLFYRGSLWGWIVSSNIWGDSTPGEMQLLEELGRILEEWLETSIPSESSLNDFYHVFEGIFLQESEDSYLLLEKKLHTIGWSPKDRKVIFEVKNNKDDFAVLENLCYRFTARRACVAGIINNVVVMLYNIESAEIAEIHKDLQNKLQLSDSFSGQSYPFNDLQEIRDQKLLADTALNYGLKIPGTINNCDDYILNYLKDLIQTNSRITFLHPAIRQLLEYDQKNGTEFLLTLYHFLMEERNYNKTAKALYVHRNTVQYRIEKILEMTGLNIEDTQTRLTITAMLYLYETTKA